MRSSRLRSSAACPSRAAMRSLAPAPCSACRSTSAKRSSLAARWPSRVATRTWDAAAHQRRGLLERQILDGLGRHPCCLGGHGPTLVLNQAAFFDLWFVGGGWI